jgi:hypothetical protein
MCMLLITQVPMKNFMHEQSTGFDQTDFKGTILCQFGNTVIALHNAHYLHTNQAD